MRQQNWLVNGSCRLYRVLLRSYPAAFRQEYGAEMEQLFRDYCRDTYHRAGAVEVGRLWLHTLYDLAVSAFEEQLAERNHEGAAMLAKRLFDIVLSIFLLMVAAPLLLLIAVLIKLDSPGPVFFQSVRMGKGGHPFQMLKFRSMTTPVASGDEPPRVTRVGRVLRQTYLDEYPQLFNVLKGEMSIIGPRPGVPTDVSLEDPTWQQLLSIRPGISGLAQVTYGHTEPNTSLPSRQELDLRYLRSRSFLLDLQLLVKQFLAMVRR